MPVYIARIYHDNHIQEVIVKADSMRLAKKAAQPKMEVTKLNPEQLFNYAQSGLVLLDSDQTGDNRTIDMFPVDFNIVKPDISKMEFTASC